MSPWRVIFPIFVASMHRLGFGLGVRATGAGWAIGLGGSSARESMLMVGFITMEGARLGACAITGAIAASSRRLGQNFLTTHQSTPKAAMPAPENTHSLFCTIQPHIAKLFYSKGQRLPRRCHR